MQRLDSILFAGLLVAFGVWWFYFRDGGAGMFDSLARAIYQFESGGKSTSVATRNNNPGNLRPPNGRSDFWTGQTGVAPGGYAIFGNFADGWDALIGDLKIKARKHPNWTIQNLFNVWLGGGPDSAPPASEGNATTYAAYVAKKIGASVTTTLAQIAGGGSAA